GKLESFLRDSDNSTGTSTLDANKGPADRVRDSWVSATNRTTATVGIHAQVLQSAYTNLSNFLWFAGRQRATVSIGSRSGGGVPFFDVGGYTGHGTKYEPAGIVHKGEWVSTAET